MTSRINRKFNFPYKCVGLPEKIKEKEHFANNLSHLEQQDL